MSRSIPVDTAFEGCDKCGYFKLEHNDFYADDQGDNVYYFCKYINICRNALRISGLTDESEKRTCFGN